MFPERIADIERHITNVLSISIRFGGKAFFYYHDHVWDRFFRGGAKVWGNNFITICPNAQIAATAVTSAQPLRCDHCVTWDHPPEKCPFRWREEGAGRSRRPAPQQQTQQLQQQRGPSSILCKFFNSSRGCNRGEGCFHKKGHFCATCSAKDHGATSCTQAGKQTSVDYSEY